MGFGLTRSIFAVLAYRCGGGGVKSRRWWLAGALYLRRTRSRYLLLAWSGFTAVAADKIIRRLRALGRGSVDGASTITTTRSPHILTNPGLLPEHDVRAENRLDILPVDRKLC